MSRLKSTATKEEIIVIDILKELRIEFKFQRVFFGKKRFIIADFYLPWLEIVLEIDGLNHKKEENRIYDDYRTKFLLNRCHISEVIRFDNYDVNHNIEKIKTELTNKFFKNKEDYLTEMYLKTVG